MHFLWLSMAPDRLPTMRSLISTVLDPGENERERVSKGFRHDGVVTKKRITSLASWVCNHQHARIRGHKCHSPLDNGTKPVCDYRELVDMQYWGSLHTCPETNLLLTLHPYCVRPIGARIHAPCPSLLRCASLSCQHAAAAPRVPYYCGSRTPSQPVSVVKRGPRS
jgi:hypothetical protein